VFRLEVVYTLVGYVIKSWVLALCGFVLEKQAVSIFRGEVTKQGSMFVRNVGISPQTHRVPKPKTSST
jgi:hypothetical protein